MVIEVGAIVLLMVAGYFTGNAIVNGINDLFHPPKKDENDDD